MCETFVHCDNKTWFVLGILAEGLRECALCKEPLLLSNCLGEKKFGLASHLYIRCSNQTCQLVNTIPTDSRTGRSPFDVNLKASAGEYNFTQL